MRGRGFNHQMEEQDGAFHTLDWKWIHEEIQWELNPENMQPYKKAKKNYIDIHILYIYIYHDQ